MKRAAAVYGAARSRAASMLYGEALATAEAQGQSEVALEARFWHGASLHSEGRLRDAVRVLEPAWEIGPGEHADPLWLYRSWTRHVLARSEIPAPLGEVERDLERAEQGLAERGDCSERGRFLLVRARIAAARGLFREAAELSREALDLYDDEQGSFSATTYGRTLVTALLRLGRTSEVAGAMTVWAEASESDSFKDCHTAAAQSELARREGRLPEAVRWARKAELEARDNDDLPARLAAGLALVRSLGGVGEDEGARVAVRRLLRLRHAEAGTDRYSIELARGDYHLQRVCLLARIPILDPESGREGPSVPGHRDPAAIDRELERAREAYRRADRLGKRLDAQLDCEFRTDEVASRRKILAQMEGVVQTGPWAEKEPIPSEVGIAEPDPLADFDIAPSSTSATVDRRAGSYRRLAWTESDASALADRLRRGGYQFAFAGRLEATPAETSLDLDVWLRRTHVGSLRARVRPLGQGQMRLAIAVPCTGVDRGLRHLPDELCQYRSLALFEQGVKETRTGNVEAGRRCFAETVSIAPTFAMAWNNLAHCQLELGEVEEAQRTVVRALELRSFPDGWCTLAEVMLRLGEPDEARQSYEQALELLPECSDQYAYVVEQLGKIGESI
jgi:tetratricopeptide (TPR) repeat protein